MGRNRINYQNQFLFAAPSPGTGHHFIDLYGNLNNNYHNSTNNNNLLFPIDRVQSISYDINQNRQRISMVGKTSSIASPIVNSPEVNLNFDYLLIGVRNEARLGLNVNYAQYENSKNGGAFFVGYSGLVYVYDSFISTGEDGVYQYVNNFGLPLISGLYARDLDKYTGIWPYNYRDGKNFYVAFSSEGVDANNSSGVENFSSLASSLFANPNSQTLQVFGFGNCYLNNYNVNISVGQIPNATVGFNCFNVAFYSSGSGTQIVGVESKTGTSNSSKFVIPDIYKTTNPSILLPGDVNLTITDEQNNNPTDFGYNYTDIKINSYSLNFSLNREDLRALGYKYPIDKPLNFPVVASIGIEAIVGDLFTGSIEQLTRRDKNYFITLKVKEQTPTTTYTGTILQPGIWTGARRTSLQHDIRYAKFDSITYNSSIGTNNIINLNYSVDLYPNNTNTGVFISGLLHLDKLEEYFHDGQGDYLALNSGDVMISDFIPIY